MVFFVRPAAADVTRPDDITLARAAAPLPPDPTLADPGWQAGKTDVTLAFTNLATRRAAPAGTMVYLLYDDRALYVAFHASQPGIPIAASQATNGVGFGIDDFVGIGIDPGGNGSQVYYFETTPRGTRYQQASENARYAPAWKAAARIDGDGWDAVLIIPLDALRLQSGTQHWRINLVRGLATTGDHLTWAFTGIMSDGPIGAGWPSFADARFWPTVRPFSVEKIRGVPHTPRADLYALGSAGQDRAHFQQADGSFRQERIRMTGVDVAVPLTEKITFVGTLAPDFSNVEIDQDTIAPQEFRRALTEFRPFFAQGASFLNANPAPIGGFVAPENRIFYSPSIGPFDRGMKIEGTHKNDSFGMLSVRGYDLTAQSTIDDIAYGFKHALPDRTFSYWADGVLAHHSSAGSDATSEFGVEERDLTSGFSWTANHAIERGTIPGGAAHSTNGSVAVHKPNYALILGYVDVSPHYNPVDGFTANSDVRGPSALGRLHGNGAHVKSWELTLFADRLTDRSGAVHQADTSVELSATLKNGFSMNSFGANTGLLRSYDVTLGPGCTGRVVSRSAFTGAPCYLNGRTDRFNFFNAGFGYRDGTPSPIDWSYAWGPFGSVMLHQFTTTTSRPLAGRFSLSLEYDGTWERSSSTGQVDSQFLRRVGLGASLGRDSNMSISLRSINGNGGFASPGTNLAATFHRHWSNGNELYFDFGTPAAASTLNRYIMKFVIHVGTLPGT